MGNREKSETVRIGKKGAEISRVYLKVDLREKGCFADIKM
jgi:hypothetical protein